MKFIKRALQLCLLSLTLCTIGLFTAATAPAATYYIDYGAGSNSNNGLSQGAAWKTAPQMNHGGACDNGTVPVYTHTSGDQFIFRGGVTWPAACFQVTLSVGGTSNAQDYWGVCVSNTDFLAEANHPLVGAINDSPCATGTSWPSSGWTRPVWGGSNAYIASGDRFIYANGVHDNTAAGFGYITIDNIEIGNWNVSPGGIGSGNTDSGPAIALGGAQNYLQMPGSVVENMYIHDWVADTAATTQGGGNGWAYGTVYGAAIMRNSVISDQLGHYNVNNGTNHLINYPFMGGCAGCGEVKNSTVKYAWMGCSSCYSVHDSDFSFIEEDPSGLTYPNPPTGIGIHSHIIYDDGGLQQTYYVYNNAIHDSPNAGLNVYVAYESYVFNNVAWNLGNNGAFVLDKCIALGNPCNDSSSQVGYFANNTTDESGTGGLGCYRWNPGSAAGLGTLNMYNNICIPNGSGTGSFSVATINGTATNYTMNPPENTTYGFVAANKYSPTSSDSNIAQAGANLTSSCSGNLAALCFDTRGAAWFGGSYLLRPTGSTAWDKGAYVGLGGTSSPPGVVFTSPTAGSHTGVLTLTVTATPQGSATITSCQFTIDGFTFGLPITTSPYTATWDTNTASNARAHTLGASCTDSNTLIGNASTVAVTPANVHLHNGWVSDSLWAPDITNVSFPAHSQTSGTSTYSYCVTPYTAANNDTETGFSQNLPTTYGDFAVILAIRNGGYIQVYNGTGGVGYTTDAGATAYPVTANVTYCFQLSVNMTAKNFTVIETSPNAVTIAGGTTPYGFRNTSTTSINYLSAYASTDSTPDTVEVSKFPPPPTNLIITNEQ